MHVFRYISICVWHDTHISFPKSQSISLCNVFIKYMFRKGAKYNSYTILHKNKQLPHLNVKLHIRQNYILCCFEFLFEVRFFIIVINWNERKSKTKNKQTKQNHKKTHMVLIKWEWVCWGLDLKMRKGENHKNKKENRFCDFYIFAVCTLFVK